MNLHRLIPRKIRTFLGQEQSLRRRLITGSAWLTVARTLGAGTELVRGIIFVRLLQPEDFGLMGIMALCLAGLGVVSETGLNTYVIQRKGEIEQDLNTIWTMKFIRGWALAGVTFLGAPVVSRFFADPQLVPLLRVISLSFIIGGLDNFGVQLLNRQLEFKRPALFGLLANAISAVTGIILALILRNVWALVGFHLVGTVSSVVISYLLSSYRPRFAFNRGVAKGAFRFGRHLFLSNILIYIITQGDDAFVGKFLGLVALGYYTRAYFLSNTPATHITQLISSVMLSGYSRLQDEPRRLWAAHKQTLTWIAVTTIPLGLGLVAFATPLVSILFGERWLPIVPAMRVLCIFGMVRALVGVNGSLLTAIGRTDAISAIGLIQVVVLAALIYPLASAYGLVGVSWAVVFCVLANLAANIYFLRTCCVGGVRLWERSNG